MTVYWKQCPGQQLGYLPETSGVYVIVVTCRSGKVIAFYTGQAKNLRTRLMQHAADSESNASLKKLFKRHLGAVRIAYCELSKQWLDGAEKYLFDYYEPQATERAPDATPVAISLPEGITKGKVRVL